MLSCTLLFPSLFAAQTRKPAKPLPASAFKLIAIKVTGNNRYTPEEIIGATGLQVGQTAHEEDFKKASQQLGETGAFSDVAYTYQYSAQGTKLDLQVEDSNQFIPVRFDNFVWFSDDELTGLLRSRLALFEGRVPSAGNLADQVAQALKQILDDKKIFGEAEYLPAGALNGPITSYVYKVNLHPVVVRNMEFSGAAQAELPALEAAAKPLTGQDYLRSKMRVQEQLNLLRQKQVPDQAA